MDIIQVPKQTQKLIRQHSLKPLHHSGIDPDVAG